MYCHIYVQECDYLHICSTGIDNAMSAMSGNFRSTINDTHNYAKVIDIHDCKNHKNH